MPSSIAHSQRNGIRSATFPGLPSETIPTQSLSSSKCGRIGGTISRRSSVIFWPTSTFPDLPDHRQNARIFDWPLRLGFEACFFIACLFFGSDILCQVASITESRPGSKMKNVHRFSRLTRTAHWRRALCLGVELDVGELFLFHDSEAKALQNQGVHSREAFQTSFLEHLASNLLWLACNVQSCPTTVKTQEFLTDPFQYHPDYGAVWRLELQKRGAPHFHLLVYARDGS